MVGATPSQGEGSQEDPQSKKTPIKRNKKANTRHGMWAGWGQGELEPKSTSLLKKDKDGRWLRSPRPGGADL